MARPVDEKIVKMSLDNQDFKSKADETIGIFGRIKEGLNKIPGVNLGKTVEDLGQLKNTAGGIDMGKLSGAVETVGDRFSAMGIIGMTVLTNLTNKAIDTGLRMAKSLALDGIKDGFAEYELKMGSVQTIMSGSGESLDVVNEKLAQLNEYSDKTIYSFKDMTSNIGKFTNAGVNLDDSVAAIQGISNVAALSGANANEASRAMYNFSQALSSGAVKLIDWKSIENANMATVEFKEQLLESAVAAGTVERAAGGMYKVLSKDNTGKVYADLVSPTKNFNDSLKAQWMTSDALIGSLKDYADETTDIGRRAFASAQDVKTFSQMMDTTKEAIGSGWAQSFEIIIGDFEEAKTLFTKFSLIIGDAIGAGADARNKMLQEASDKGAFTNVFDGLLNIIKTVFRLKEIAGEAMAVVFPEGAVDIIVRISEGFKSFTESLYPTSRETNKLRSNLETFFKVVRLGMDIVKGIANVFINLIPDNLFKMLSNVASAFGEVLGVLFKSSGAGTGVKEFFDNMASRADKFSKVLEPIISLIGGKLVGALRYLRDNIPNWEWPFSLKDNALLQGASDMVGKFTDKVRKFNETDKPKDIFSDIKTGAVGKITAAFEGLGKVFGWVKDKIGGFITKLKEATGGIGLEEIWGSAALGGGFLLFKKFSGLVDGLIDKLNPLKSTGLLDSIKSVFGGLQESLSAFTGAIKATILMQISAALVAIAIALMLLQGIKSEDLQRSLAALGGALAGLMTAMYGLSKIDMSGFSTGKMVATLMGLSVSLMLIAGTVKKMANIKPDELRQGLMAMGTILVVLIGTLGLVVAVGNKVKNPTAIAKSVTGLIGLTIVLKLATTAIEKLGKMDPQRVESTIVSLAKVLGVLVGSFVLLSAVPLKGLSNINTFFTFAAGLGTAAVAIAIFSLVLPDLIDAVERMGNIDMDVLKQGLVTLGILLLELGVFQKLTGGSGSIMSAAGLILVTVAIERLIEPLRSLGAMDQDALIQGLLGLGVALVAISAAMTIAKGSFTGAVGILVVVEALKGLYPVIQDFGNMSMEQIAKGLLALAGGLILMVGALILASGTLSGAAALVVAAAAINLLVIPITALGNLKLEQILLGLGAIAGVFVIMGVAGVVLGPLTLTLIGLAGAIALLGVGTLAIGGGLLLFAAGLSALSGSVVIAAVAIVEALDVLLDGIIHLSPKLGDALGALIQMMARVIIENTPAIMTAATVLIVALLKTIVDLLPKLIELGVMFIVALIVGITKGMPLIVMAAIDMLIGFIDGMAVAIRVKGPELVDAVLSLVGEMLILLINSFIDILNEFLGWIPGVTEALGHVGESSSEFLREKFGGDRTGQAMADDVAKGLNQGGSHIATGAQDIAELTNEKFSKPDFDATGRAITTDVAGGMEKGSGSIDLELEGILAGITGGIGSLDMTKGGKDITTTLGNGIGSESGGLLDMTSLLGDDIDMNLLGGDLLDPATKKMLGMDEGLNKGGEKVKKSAREVSNAVEDTMDAPDFKTKGDRVTSEYSKGMQDGKPKVIQTATELKDGVDKELANSNPQQQAKDKLDKYNEGMRSKKPLVLQTSAELKETMDKELANSNPQQQAKDKLDKYNEGLYSKKPLVLQTSAELKATMDKQLASGDTARIGRSEVDDFTEGMSSKKGSVFSTAKGLSSSGRAGFTSVSTFGTGAYFSDGVIKGIKSKRKEVGAAARGLANTGLNSMNETLSINSPSEETTESGEFFGEGLIRGIRAMIGGTKAAAKDMATDTMKVMNEFIGDFAGSFEKDNELEVTVRPVMDLDSMVPIPDQQVRLRTGDTIGARQLPLIDNATSQNENTTSRLLEVLADRGPKQNINNTYEIHLTANGDLPRSSIKRMASQLQEEIKNISDSDKMSKGITVNY